MAAWLSGALPGNLELGLTGGKSTNGVAEPVDDPLEAQELKDVKAVLDHHLGEAPPPDDTARMRGFIKNSILFVATWFGVAALLTLIELPLEKRSLNVYTKHEEHLEDIVDSTVWDEIQDVLDWMQDKGNCYDPLSGSKVSYDWDFFGALFFTFTIPTCVGYGNFSVNTTLGRVVVVIYSLFSIPLLMMILGDMEYLFLRIQSVRGSASGDKAPVESAKSKLKRIFNWMMFYIALLSFWIVVVGGLGIGKLMGWREIDGIYFSWISLTTIGLGDYTFDMDITKGLGIIFIATGLSLFTIAITYVARFAGMKYDQIMLDANEARLKEIRNNYGTEELSTLNRAFDLADYAGADQLQPPQIKIVMQILGMTLTDTQCDELLIKHDRDRNGFLARGEFLEFMYPNMTEDGRRKQLFDTIKGSILIWGLIFVYVFIGGLCMQELELEHNKNSNDHWAKLIENHGENLNATGQARLSNLISHQVNKGICSVPSCSSYEGDDDSDIFACKSYAPNWDLKGSTFFCWTVVTTIGYGSFSPQTDSGKIFTIFYSLVGIILFGIGVTLLLALPEQIHSYSGDVCMRKFFNFRTNIKEEQEINMAVVEEQEAEMELRKRIEANEKLPPAEREIILDEDGLPIMPSSRGYKALTFLESTPVLSFIILLVFVDLVLMMMHHDDNKAHHDDMTWQAVFSNVCSAIFALDILGRFAIFCFTYYPFGVSPVKFWAPLRILDLVVVLIDVAIIVLGVIMDANTGSARSVKSIRSLRVLRTARYLRFARLMKSSKTAQDLWKNRVYVVSVLTWVSIVVAYICIAGLLLMTLEADNDWSFWEACYFLWISVTTIGLGDYVPAYDNIIPVMVIVTIGIAITSQALGEFQSMMAKLVHGTVEPEESESRLKTVEKAINFHHSTVVPLQASLSPEIQEKVKQAFEDADKEGLASLSPSQYVEAVTALKVADVPSTQEAKDIIMNYDIKGELRVNATEFLVAVHQKHGIGASTPGSEAPPVDDTDDVSPGIGSFF